MGKGCDISGGGGTAHYTVMGRLIVCVQNLRRCRGGKNFFWTRSDVTVKEEVVRHW